MVRSSWFVVFPLALVLACGSDDGGNGLFSADGSATLTISTMPETSGASGDGDGDPGDGDGDPGDGDGEEESGNEETDDGGDETGTGGDPGIDGQDDGCNCSVDEQPSSSAVLTVAVLAGAAAYTRPGDET